MKKSKQLIHIQIATDTKNFTISINKSAKCLGILMHNDNAHLHYIVDPDSKSIDRHYVLYKGGMTFDDIPMQHLGSFTLQQFNKVVSYHLFEITTK